MNDSSGYQDKLNKFLDLFPIDENLNSEIVSAEFIRLNTETICLYFNQLMDCECLMLAGLDRSHQKLENLMSQLAAHDVKLTCNMMLAACKMHPHFLNDIPYKLIPEEVKKDQDFIKGVLALHNQFRVSNNEDNLKGSSDFQHYVAWMEQNTEQLPKEGEAKGAIAYGLPRLPVSKPSENKCYKNGFFYSSELNQDVYDAYNEQLKKIIAPDEQCNLF